MQCDVTENDKIRKTVPQARSESLPTEENDHVYYDGVDTSAITGHVLRASQHP